MVSEEKPGDAVYGQPHIVLSPLSTLGKQKAICSVHELQDSLSMGPCSLSEWSILQSSNGLAVCYYCVLDDEANATSRIKHRLPASGKSSRATTYPVICLGYSRAWLDCICFPDVDFSTGDSEIGNMSGQDLLSVLLSLDQREISYSPSARRSVCIEDLSKKGISDVLSRTPRKKRVSFRREASLDALVTTASSSADANNTEFESLLIMSVTERDAALAKYLLRDQQKTRNKTRRKRVSYEDPLGDFEFDPPVGKATAAADFQSPGSLASDSAATHNEVKATIIPILTAPRNDIPRRRNNPIKTKRFIDDLVSPSGRKTTKNPEEFYSFSEESLTGLGTQLSPSTDAKQSASFHSPAHDYRTTKSGRSDSINFENYSPASASVNAGSSFSKGNELMPSRMPPEVQSDGVQSEDNGDIDVVPRPKVMLKSTLAEDLVCSYRQSKLSSCNVEGVIQVQVVSDDRRPVPFFLQLRDPSSQIQEIQENAKYVENVSSSARTARFSHCKYMVSVPKLDTSFPVLRYRCGNELRPVPIRVQTRVRSHSTQCRVALQISSNPANEDELVDLTIVMGVPSRVKGETLTTSPPGGVWNAAKRSVIWCVAELGGGEKFQLQAQFEQNNSSGDDKTKFPVLVKCHCRNSQLSTIELTAADASEVNPADISLTVERSFRLTHQERS